MNTQTTTRKAKTMTHQLYIWRWTNGGYNSCLARSTEEAITTGNAIHRACVVDEQTVHVGTQDELAKLDEQFASMCD